MEPRAAATVILVREGGAGPEVLVLRRGASQRFLPGYVAFPGGAVDPGDRDLAARWFGTPDEDARACAVRELAEEVGIAVTGTGIVAGAPLDAVHDAPPTVASLAQIARLVAPAIVPTRFDARFFAIAAPHGVDPIPDGVETDRAWWARPADVLAPGAHDLFPPTRAVLGAIAGCRDVASALALRVVGDVEEPTR
jgi:8-oxo-dGTP pyrophosphatase MutT (NUDIX family)